MIHSWIVFLFLFELGCATWPIIDNKLALHNGSDYTEENNTPIYSIDDGISGLIIQMDKSVHCERNFLLRIEEIPHGVRLYIFYRS